MTKMDRSSGILLHPTSLPGPHGIGELGSAARAFVDRLADANQSWWQILPLNPPGFGGTPYASDSAFAGNPYLVSIDRLIERGLLSEDDRSTYREAIETVPEDRYLPGRVDAARDNLLGRAFETWRNKGRPEDESFEAFRERESSWLQDYALFRALKREHDGADWRDWPDPLTRRDAGALEDAAEELEETILEVEFRQWLFDRQWRELREYARDRDVRFIGDIPIFVAMDSADVWANRRLFRVGADGEPDVVAGVPPDYFSETGQKWGNPLYDWAVLEEEDFEWWLQRLARVKETVDLVRIDHFRGFDAYWEVPADAPTAETGEWVEGPGDDFFEAVGEAFGELPFIAEDLGTITDSVRKLRDRHELPGMKVMQFAFEGDEDHPFLPHNYPENCVAYTGTHDNDTTRGWYASIDEMMRHEVRTYLSHGDEGIVWAMIESILESDAALAIFPAQDILGLDTSTRMNTPGTERGNWEWRMTESQIDDAGWERLSELTEQSGR